MATAKKAEAAKMPNAVINLSICLSDIPKDKIKSSEKNGRLYLNVTIVGRKELDQFGNNITAFVSQTKDERSAKADKEYIGAGTYVGFSDAAAEENLQPMSELQADDLPF